MFISVQFYIFLDLYPRILNIRLLTQYNIWTRSILFYTGLGWNKSMKPDLLRQ